jgi:TPR repeat protein
MTVEDDEQYAARSLEAGNYPEAARVLRGLAERNSVYALLGLGWMHETGVIGAASNDAARSYYELAAGEGSAYAYFCIGRLLAGSGQDREAHAVLARGAKLGSDECKSELARLEDKAAERRAGQALETENYEEAVRLFTPLAERGSSFGLFSLGWIYEAGVIGDPDWESATTYYRRAADKGFLPAYFELGRLLSRRGKDAQARAAFEAGAERGHIACMAWLGRMMAKGEGGVTDISAGSRWLQTAAAQGQVSAERSLLAIEERDARSVLEKLSIKRKILSLALRGAKEMWKDPLSDKVR